MKDPMNTTKTELLEERKAEAVKARYEALEKAYYKAEKAYDKAKEKDYYEAEKAIGEVWEAWRAFLKEIEEEGK